jgi:hypothetical protein
LTVLLRAAVYGQSLVSSLDDFETLTGYAGAIATIARNEGPAGLLAASGPAERLVGSAIAVAGGAAHGWQPGRSETAILCDIVLASGSSCTEAAAKARHRGATRVVAVVIQDLFGSSDCGLDGIDEIHVLTQRGFVANSGLAPLADTGISLCRLTERVAV